MGSSIARALYYLFRIPHEREADSVVEDGVFHVKAPLDLAVGRIVLSLQLDDMEQHFNDQSDLMKINIDESLFGASILQGNPHKTCFSCGRAGITHVTSATYETKFWSTRINKMYLCTTCYRGIKRIVVSEFSRECPELATSWTI